MILMKMIIVRIKKVYIWEENEEIKQNNKFKKALILMKLIYVLF